MHGNKHIKTEIKTRTYVIYASRFLFFQLRRLICMQMLCKCSHMHECACENKEHTQSQTFSTCTTFTIQNKSLLSPSKRLKNETVCMCREKDSNKLVLKIPALICQIKSGHCCTFQQSFCYRVSWALTSLTLFLLFCVHALPTPEESNWSDIWWLC